MDHSDESNPTMVAVNRAMELVLFCVSKRWPIEEAIPVLLLALGASANENPDLVIAGLRNLLTRLEEDLKGRTVTKPS